MTLLAFPRCLLILVVLSLTVQNTSAESASPPGKDALHLTVLDETGQPLEGADIAPYLELSMESDTGHAVVRQSADHGPVRTDARGQADLPVSQLSGDPSGAAPQYWVYHEPSGRGGLFKIDPTNISSPLEVRVGPMCKVCGSVSSSRLAELGQALKGPWVHVNAPGGGAQLLCFVGTDGRFSFMLPPGDYNDFILFARNAYPVRRAVSIGADDRELQLEAIDLQASYLTELIGKPAPELQQVKAWKNSEPLMLSDLHGKVVLLDFWGYWCPPCVAQMPRLMSLHERYAEDGLVIIAVHDDSASSIEDLDQKLKETRESLWRGRDLAFPVALDGGGRTMIPDRIGRQTSGATTAAYGVDSWPTTVLINRDGVVVQAIDLADEEAETQIASLLGVSLKPTQP